MKYISNCRNPGLKPALFAAIILLLSGTTWAQGTLSGTVVDAADGTTPVFPVIVDLIDPVTGEDPPGLIAVTDSEGFYEITDIPVGEWKIIFNAVDTTSAYADELYDGVVCDNGECGMDVNGDVLVINVGANVLDVDLERSFTLSGRVSNESDQPFVGVAVDVLDASSFLVDGAAFTNSNGEWIKNVPGPGPNVYSGTWTVNNGIVSYSGGSYFYGEVTELKESYIDYTFFWIANSDGGYRMRVTRVNDP